MDKNLLKNAPHFFYLSLRKKWFWCLIFHVFDVRIHALHRFKKIITTQHKLKTNKSGFVPNKRKIHKTIILDIIKIFLDSICKYFTNRQICDNNVLLLLWNPNCRWWSLLCFHSFFQRVHVPVPIKARPLSDK